jgi:hypothetical protein
MANDTKLKQCYRKDSYMTLEETQQVQQYIAQMQAAHEAKLLAAVESMRYVQQVDHDKTTKHLNIARVEAVNMGKALVQIEILLCKPEYATLQQQFEQITDYYCQDYGIPF